MNITENKLSEKKCPPIDNLQKNTKIPNNKFNQIKIEFFIIIVPTKKRKSCGCFSTNPGAISFTLIGFHKCWSK